MVASQIRSKLRRLSDNKATGSEENQAPECSAGCARRETKTKASLGPHDHGWMWDEPVWMLGVFCVFRVVRRDTTRRIAMNVLGCTLSIAKRYEDALSLKEAELSMMRRLGASNARRAGQSCDVVFESGTGREGPRNRTGCIPWELEATGRGRWYGPRGACLVDRTQW